MQMLEGVDTVIAVLGQKSSAEDRAAAREELHLDDPLPVRYVQWAGDAVQGDLGTSFRTRQPVTEAIGQRIWVTLELVLISQLIALLLAVPMAKDIGVSTPTVFAAFSMALIVSALARGVDEGRGASSQRRHVRAARSVVLLTP